MNWQSKSLTQISKILMTSVILYLSHYISNYLIAYDLSRWRKLFLPYAHRQHKVSGMFVDINIIRILIVCNIVWYMSNNIFIGDLSLCCTMESNGDWSRKTLLRNFVLKKFLKNNSLYALIFPSHAYKERNTSDVRYVNLIAETTHIRNGLNFA